jgi:hypothetical protein
MAELAGEIVKKAKAYIRLDTGTPDTEKLSPLFLLRMFGASGGTLAGPAV